MRSFLALVVPLVLACTIEGSLGRDGEQGQSDTAIPEACALEQSEDQCTDCLKRRCCDDLAACTAQGSCQCVADCVQQGEPSVSCREQCDAIDDPAWLDYDECAATMCTERCPRPRGEGTDRGRPIGWYR